jgi:methylenetetrahydrofolate--tRNA-(uracil-5-)-methyltransferase
MRLPHSYLDTPLLLDETLRLKTAPHIRFAGQITGCEGYVESAAVGLLAARFAAADVLGRAPATPPLTSAHGALLAHVTGRLAVPGADFQPMNINFGLFPPMEGALVDEDGKRVRGKAKTLVKKAALSRRALADFQAWLGETERLAA